VAVHQIYDRENRPCLRLVSWLAVEAEEVQAQQAWAAVQVVRVRICQRLAEQEEP